MGSASSIAISGLAAAQLRLDASSHNIANWQTPNFRREEVTQRELPEGGVTATIEQAESTVPKLNTDIVEQIQAGYTFDANLRTLRTEQDMLGTLIDLKA